MAAEAAPDRRTHLEERAVAAARWEATGRRAEGASLLTHPTQEEARAVHRALAEAGAPATAVPTNRASPTGCLEARGAVVRLGGAAASLPKPSSTMEAMEWATVVAEAVALAGTAEEAVDRCIPLREAAGAAAHRGSTLPPRCWTPRAAMDKAPEVPRAPAIAVQRGAVAPRRPRARMAWSS